MIEIKKETSEFADELDYFKYQNDCIKGGQQNKILNFLFLKKIMVQQDLDLLDEYLKTLSYERKYNLLSLLADDKELLASDYGKTLKQSIYNLAAYERNMFVSLNIKEKEKKNEEINDLVIKGNYTTFQTIESRNSDYIRNELLCRKMNDTKSGFNFVKDFHMQLSEIDYLYYSLKTITNDETAKKIVYDSVYKYPIRKKYQKLNDNTFFEDLFENRINAYEKVLSKKINL